MGIKPKIALGIPTGGTMKSKTAFSLLETIRTTDADFLPIFRYGNFAAENKEKIVKIAQENLCSHIFFVDCDMGFPADALTKLLAHDKDIVGVNYNYRYMPQESITKPFRYPIDASNDLYRVAAAGTGLILVKTSVFPALERPYFPFALSDSGDMILTEDVGFCEKARGAGFDVWIDPFIKVEHYGDFAY